VIYLENKKLLKEIEHLRKQLHIVVELANGDLLSKEVLELSQKLDQFLVKYQKNNSS